MDGYHIGYCRVWIIVTNCENATEALHKFTTVTGHTAGAIQSYCWRYKSLVNIYGMAKSRTQDHVPQQQIPSEISDDRYCLAVH